MRKIPEESDNPIDNFILKIVDPLCPLFKALHFTPNGITTISLVFGLLSAYLLYKGHPYLFGITFFISYFFDCMDGYYARKYNMVTRFGDIYDHVKDIVVTGGMPSTHSALVWAMAVSIFLSEGISTAFVLSVVLLVIVLRDAMGVRRTAGEEGHIIHQIIKKTNLKIKEYHYAMGHTPKQVVVGSVIGIAVSFIVYGLL